MSELGTIVEQLRQQETQLNQQKAKLTKDLDSINSELCRVLDALTALNGQKQPKTKKGKPSPKKEHVRDALRVVLEEKQCHDHTELSDEVGKQILAAGYSRSGLALRLKEVLQEDEFETMFANNPAVVVTE